MLEKCRKNHNCIFPKYSYFAQETNFQILYKKRIYFSFINTHIKKHERETQILKTAYINLSFLLFTVNRVKQKLERDI